MTRCSILNSAYALLEQYEKVEKLAKAASSTEDDVKGVVAALHFILRNAAKYNVPHDYLITELQQLGLPKEHCDAISRAYKDRKEEIRHALFSSSLRLNSFDSCDWRADLVLSSSICKNINSPCVNFTVMRKNPDGERESRSFILTGEKFRLLRSELKGCKIQMDNLT